MNRELLEYTYVIRYKMVKHELQGTDLNGWYLQALVGWLDDYILNTPLPLYKERAKTIHEHLIELTHREIIVGTDLSPEEIDQIIFMLLLRRDV